MPYATAQDIHTHVLFRGFEAAAGSKFDTVVLDYMNRSYQMLCTGVSEFLPEYIDDWWWLRRRATLTLSPVYETGSISLTAGSTALTFSIAPIGYGFMNWMLKVEGHPEIFKIASHVADDTAAVLDSPWTGDTGAGLQFKLMKVFYDLEADTSSILSPMQGFRSNPSIKGMSPERLDELYPISELSPGAPQAFSLETLTTIRMSHGGLTEGKSCKINYIYRPTVPLLTNEASSIPLMPLEYRPILADMALTYLWLDKNDDRSNATALSARTALAAMLKENRRKLKKMGGESVGHIYPRQTQRGGRLLRTETGLIIG